MVDNVHLHSSLKLGSFVSEGFPVSLQMLEIACTWPSFCRGKLAPTLPFLFYKAFLLTYQRESIVPIYPLKYQRQRVKMC